MPLFEAKNLTKIYGGGLLDKDHNVALDNFSLTIEGDQPQITTIAGESGSGKTTLANLVLGFLTPTSGEILYRGQEHLENVAERAFRLSARGAGDFSRPLWNL